MSGAKDESENTLNSTLGAYEEPQLEDNDLFALIDDQYSSAYLLGDDTHPWRNLEGFESVNDAGYDDRYTEDDSVVVIFPDFIDAESTEDEDISNLTERLLEEEVEGLVIPSYDLGRPIAPPQDMELVESFWNQDSYAGKALLYEHQSK